MQAEVQCYQLLRSDKSLGANDREDHRARNNAESFARCGDSLRKPEESAHWLELLVDGEIVPAAKGNRFVPSATKLPPSKSLLC